MQLVTQHRISRRFAVSAGAAVILLVLLAVALTSVAPRDAAPSLEITAAAPPTSDEAEESNQEEPEVAARSEEVDVRLPDTDGHDPRGGRVAEELPPVEVTSPATQETDAASSAESCWENGGEWHEGQCLASEREYWDETAGPGHYDELESEVDRCHAERTADPRYVPDGEGGYHDQEQDGGWVPCDW